MLKPEFASSLQSPIQLQNKTSAPRNDVSSGETTRTSLREGGTTTKQSHAESLSKKPIGRIVKSRSAGHTKHAEQLGLS